MTHVLTMQEGERQAVLMALSHLAQERPGWDDLLSSLALQIDNKLPNGRPQMFDLFKNMHGSIKPVAPPMDLPKPGETEKFRISPDGLSITCKTCQRTSYNLNDVRLRYCGFCHEFHDL